MQYNYNKQIDHKIKAIKNNSIKACLLGNMEIPGVWKKRSDINTDILPSLAKNSLFKDRILQYSHELMYKNILTESIKNKSHKVLHTDSEIPKLKQLNKLDINKIKPDLNEYKMLAKVKTPDHLKNTNKIKNQVVLDPIMLDRENKDNLLDYDPDSDEQSKWFKIVGGKNFSNEEKNSVLYGQYDLKEEESKKLTILALHKKKLDGVKSKLSDDYDKIIKESKSKHDLLEEIKKQDMRRKLRKINKAKIEKLIKSKNKNG